MKFKLIHSYKRFGFGKSALVEEKHFFFKKRKKKKINLNSCSYVAILGQISFGTLAPKSCDSYSKHLTPKFHSSEVTYSSHPAPAFPAALVCCAKVPQVPKVLWLAVPRNALPVVALNACVPADRHRVQHHVLGGFFSCLSHQQGGNPPVHAELAS